MKQLLDKLLILIFCTIILHKSSSSSLPVIALLLFLALSALRQCYPHSRRSLCFLLLSILLSWCDPVFCCMLPLVIYDIVSDERYYLALLPLLSFLSYQDLLAEDQNIFILFGCILGIVLYRNTSQLLKLQHTLIQTRDTSEENKLLLEKTNKQILETQDNAIRFATMKERNRIAREIHDNVGHMLTRSLLQVGAMSIINQDKKLEESFTNLENTLNCAMTSIRSSVHDLYSDSIDLKLLLTEATNELKEQFQLSIEYDCSESIPQKIKLCLLGIVKECVSNVVKHSKGNSVTIVLREHPCFYQLVFSDNGSCSKINYDSGIGLSNMRERVNQLNGVINFTLSSSGFTTFVSVPKLDKEEKLNNQ